MKYILSIVLSGLILTPTIAQKIISKNTTMKGAKYGMTGKLTAREGKADELAEILLKASQLVAGARGIHLYVVYKDVNDANSIYVFEMWDSKDDHDNSLKLPGVRELISTAMPLIEGKPEGAVLSIFGGKGVPY